MPIEKSVVSSKRYLFKSNIDCFGIFFSHGSAPQSNIEEMLRRIGSLKSMPYEIGHRVNYMIFITLGAVQEYFAFFGNRSIKMSD